MEAYGVRTYGNQVQRPGTCDEGHVYSYTLYPTENSKGTACLSVECDETVFVSR